MSRLERVVILGAGTGTRLRPLTDDRPKCAVEIAGEPLAVRMLRQLAERGLRQATVVIGHFAERARELIGDRIGELRVEFVENRDYATTNTMYSALLGADALRQGAYLIEGDIACADRVVDLMLAAAPERSHWFVERWSPAHSGCQLRADARGRIVQQAIVRDGRPPADDGLTSWKSGGMLALTPRDGAALVRHLEAEAAAGNTRVYYDDVIGKHLADFELYVADLAGAPWVEIDDANDMAEARRLFEDPR